MSFHMNMIGAARFKEPCPSRPNRLDSKGLVVTKRGKPTARVFRYEQEFADCIGSLRGTVESRGDIMGPGARWDANAELEPGDDGP